MKICLLTPRFPFPENGGDVLRINNIARYLKSEGHNLCLVSFVEGNSQITDEARSLYDSIYTVPRKSLISAISAGIHLLCGKPIQCGYYFSFKYLSVLKEVIAKEKPDWYVAHLLRMSPYLEKLGLEQYSVVEMTDALSKTYTIAQDSKGSKLKKTIYKIEQGLIKKYEARVVAKFPKVVLVSQNDIDYLTEHCKENQQSLTMHTNGVDCLATIPNSYNEKKICFVGNMRTLQNQDAVLRFAKNILPKIQKQIPDVKFYIVGAQPSKIILDLASDNIVVTGFVDDINAAVSDSCLAVAPVFVAAGIQNKVLMAMGCGVPVVMSSLISHAIPELIDKENCFIEDDYEKFADACIRLIKERETRDIISRNGYEMIKNNYSWNEKLKGFL